MFQPSRFLPSERWAGRYRSRHASGPSETPSKTPHHRQERQLHIPGHPWTVARLHQSVALGRGNEGRL